MPAPESVLNLVQRFESQLASYHKASYNETELRRDFLDPFFAALGWDMTNTGGGSEKYREVIHEASVEVEGAAKAADYAFRLGGNNVFFVEAKKPAVNIAASVEAAFQLRSYGWSGKLKLSLLTDFEQLAVYDCRSKPKHGEAANINRVSLYHFSEYVDKWDEIYSRYSREAVFTGKFDEFAGGTKGKKGTTDVDDAFLEMLEGWRELLARNIALRNPGLSVRDLNFAVQTTIDRIIFLRICEDRGIEADDALRSATDGKDIYQDLLVLFKTADKKYNSGLFHFSNEKNQSSQADTLTPTLKIDDKVLKEILAGLYHPSPYAFKYIPADILGQVYERFLGKVIRLTSAHQAKVEEKPEVRKAGGVYYTPTYIVEYIVKNTLGELLQGETPETQQAKPLRVLDPACGSGSFLLGAYQYLLDWYLEWYASHEPARHARGKSPAVVEAQGGWQLTMEKKKEILLAHIFGVDIDAQAVEVTKLSLLLKVVENPGQLSLLDERILPDLGENVKCGNSLIGPDYYNGRQMPMFGDEELYRVNPFDWQAAFPQVFASEPAAKAAMIKPALPPELLKRCRDLRMNQTSAEGLLWSLLRDRQLNGLKFRRQHPLGGYILDFYCHEAQLAVELDGSGHLEAEQARHDEQRTQDLEALGVRVVRMWNHEVLSDPQSALLAILAAVEDPHKDPHSNPRRAEDPHPNPLPKGEGKDPQGSGLSSSPREALPKGAGRGARGEGGFDAVIGNPPYVRQETLGEQKQYFQRHYQTYHGMADLYTYFVEKGVNLLRAGGRFGYIVANKWMRTNYGIPLRKWLPKQGLDEITDFGDLPVFDQATTYPCILIITKSTQINEVKVTQVKSLDFSSLQEYQRNNYYGIPNSSFGENSWSLTNQKQASILSSLRNKGVSLGIYVNHKIYYGIKTALNEAFVIDENTYKEIIQEDPKSIEFIKPFLVGRNVKHFETPATNQYVIIIPKGWTNKQLKGLKNAWGWFHSNYPGIASHLSSFADAAQKRQDKGDYWWELRACEYYSEFEKPKIVYPNICKRPEFTFDENGLFTNQKCFIIPINDKYLLGLLNSSITFFLFRSSLPKLRGDFYEPGYSFVVDFPIRTINFNDPTDVKRHERMVALVESMLGLHKRLAAAGSPQEKELLQRQIAYTDREIDALVYELYGLTDEEIKIVEGA